MLVEKKAQLEAKLKVRLFADALFLCAYVCMCVCACVEVCVCVCVSVRVRVDIVFLHRFNVVAVRRCSRWCPAHGEFRREQHSHGSVSPLIFSLGVGVVLFVSPFSCIPSLLVSQ